MILLGLDSSSKAATAAVLRDGELLCEYTQNQDKTQSVKMLPMIEKMLSDVELSLSDIDIFVCGVGPGSFTGVRIGVATARGLSESLGKDTVSVTSLEILAHNVSGDLGYVIALLSAREDECYAAVYHNGDEIVPPCVMTLLELAEYAKEKDVLFVGEGAIEHKDALLELVPHARFAKGKQNMISAASAVEIGARKAEEGNVAGSDGLIPLYLRKSQAEREYEQKMKNVK